MARVSDGSVRIRASEWPSFLYDHNTAFDPEDEEKGLLKGYVLLRVSLLLLQLEQLDRYILTGFPPHIHGSIISPCRSSRRDEAFQGTATQAHRYNRPDNCLCSSPGTFFLLFF